MGWELTTPIVLFSDHPASPSGLARITRDLATRIHENMGDTFRVATLGYGSPGSVSLPFPQYHWKERDDFLPLELTHIAKDFCADQPFILMTIGDVQRFLPLADGKFSQDPGFSNWVTTMRRSGQMKLWGYFPVDAHSTGGGLGPQLGHTLSHYDRRVVPSEWAKGIVRKTLPNHECAAIPHGIDTSVFKPYPKEKSQDEFGALLASVINWPKSPMSIPDEALWIGIVATNQSRKDWGLGIEIAAELKKTRPIALWCHTDRVKREWSLLELLSDFGLLGCSIVTQGHVPDDVMASSYSACDLTLGIGRGEGFGYPIFESIFCGTPCFAYAYGGHAEFMDVHHRVPTAGLRIEGPLNLLRPLGVAGYWAHRILSSDSPSLDNNHAQLDWNQLWPKWAEWLKAGLR